MAGPSSGAWHRNAVGGWRTGITGFAVVPGCHFVLTRGHSKPRRSIALGGFECVTGSCGGGRSMKGQAGLHELVGHGIRIRSTSHLMPEAISLLQELHHFRKIGMRAVQQMIVLAK